ncbi:hypothetical protein D3C81_790690 [compost metagenome]
MLEQNTACIAIIRRTIRFRKLRYYKIIPSKQWLPKIPTPCLSVRMMVFLRISWISSWLNGSNMIPGIETRWPITSCGVSLRIGRKISGWVPTWDFPYGPTARWKKYCRSINLQRAATATVFIKLTGIAMAGIGWEAIMV